MASGDQLSHPQLDALHQEAYLIDGSRLAQWEEDLAANMLPGINLGELESWPVRPSLSDLLHKGLAFHGSLYDIQIIPESQARETLVETLQQTPKPRFATAGFNKPKGNPMDIPPDKMYSFILSATGHSVASSEGLGDIYAQIWYEVIMTPKNSNNAVDIRRYVAGPIADEAAFKRLANRSRVIGRHVVAAAMSNAYRSGMSGASQQPEKRKTIKANHP